MSKACMCVCEGGVELDKKKEEVYYYVCNKIRCTTKYKNLVDYTTHRFPKTEHL